jgi:DNA-binding NarL/FixJ family response regulator
MTAELLTTEITPLLIVIADDEFDFRNTVIQWIASEYRLSDELLESAIEAVGDEDSQENSFLISESNPKFLIVSVLEQLWNIVALHAEHNQRILIILDLGWGDSSDALLQLQNLRNDESQKHYPVIIYSKSDTEDDIKRAYEATANCYIVKTDGSPEERKKRFLNTLTQWQGHYLPPFAITSN